MLNIRVHFAEIQARYEESAQKKKANFLIYSKPGGGKTRLIGTAPGPVLVHSFDPGGTRTLATMISQGTIKAENFILDTRFEKEDNKKPTVYKAWEKEVNELLEDKAFAQLGTYVIDSGTGWLVAMMNEIIKQDPKNNTVNPQIQNYGMQQTFVQGIMGKLTSIPCNFVLTGHIDTFIDATDGRVHTSLLAAGKLKTKLPLWFDEFWVIDVKKTARGIDRQILTSITGKHEARTRIGAEGVFTEYIKPDIREALKVAGYPYKDKESLTR